MKRLALLKTGATCLLVLIVAEVFTHTALNHWIYQPHCYQTVRNPYARRNWVRYTEPREREPNQQLVIVISNSQGFGREIENGSDLYTAHLPQELATAGVENVVVANWSAGGMGGPEMVLLAARAVEHNPDLIVFVSHTRPFSRGRVHDPISFFNTDISDLAYLTETRSKLPQKFVNKYEANDDATVLKNRLSLLELGARWFEPRGGRWFTDIARPKRAAKEKAYGTPKLDKTGRWLLSQTTAVAQSKNKNQPVLWVSMPLGKRYCTQGGWETFTRFSDELKEQISSSAQILDAINLLPNNQFYTAAHMNEEGHAAFAQWLAPSIAQVLTQRQETSSPTHD